MILHVLHTGCPRVAGDGDESYDGEDFDDEFPKNVNNHHNDYDHNINHFANNSVIFRS